MIVFGIILLVVGWIVHLAIVMDIGIVLLVIGLILALLHGTGHGVGGRHYF
jgi:hypothetical protein